MKSAFEHKPELRLSEFVIEKTVRISDESFERMLRRPMDGQPFIAENIDLMYQDDDDVFHCILVTGENRTDGILVESEGYGYARYASYIPEISALGYPSLAAWNRKLMSAADLIVEAGITRSESSKWRLTYEELEKQTGLCLKEQPFWGEMLRDMLLCDRGAVSELCLGDDALEVVYNPDFIWRDMGNGLEKQNVSHKEQQWTLKELLLTGVPLNTYLTHSQDVGFVPIGRLTPSDLTSSAIQNWRDILDAKITLIKQGAYGLEIELADVTAERLMTFDEFLSKIPYQSPELEMKF